MFFSFVVCRKKKFVRGQKVFVKREKQTTKFFDQLRLKRGIFTFLFSHNTRREQAQFNEKSEKVFGIRLVFTKWLVCVLFSHFWSLELGEFKSYVCKNSLNLPLYLWIIHFLQSFTIMVSLESKIMVLHYLYDHR